MMDLEKITKETIKVAKKAGNFIKKEAAAFDRNVVEYKAINNVVSYVDKETEKMIVRGLSKIVPDAGFITEEETVAQSTDNQELKRNAARWIIDPLDGTANFIHGLPVFSVSIALAQGSEVIVGVVYNINAKEVYSAWKGGGAFCNGKKIAVSPIKTLNESLLATGFPYYKFDNQDKYLKILESLMQKTHGLRRMGSAAIDLAYVASGKFDGFYEYNLNSWDMAAGVLLIKEAGGIVSDFSGGENYLFGGDIVAGSAVQVELLREIQRFWK
jgi:myo-inositol-1(or 4)-monophosphatase